MRCLGAIWLLAGCFTKPARPVEGVDGMPTEDGPGATSQLVHFKNAANSNTSSLTYNVETSADSVLFVSVHTGADCSSVSPNVQSVTAQTTPMMRVDQIAGLPGCANNAATEIWMLVDPPAASLVPITVALDGVAGSLHSGALDFIGVDRADPVRMLAKRSDQGSGSLVTVDSDPGDLVFDVVVQGHGIVGPGGGQTQIYRDNRGTSTTSNNSASSTARGTELTTLVWEFDQVDYWQTIAIALRPSP